MNDAALSIPMPQRAPMPRLIGTPPVYPRAADKAFTNAVAETGGYLASSDEMCPEKRPDWAIDIARPAGCH